ncbi:MAG: 2-C-methyl-D-erythritol 4-phosphate cytidylyltransferase [Planctomycetota bacterium]|jgi:2-C-methyl-D-erythritol 4-phosphate cytidylyltransferase|nr:2-C-methyl-D-erythritol 4-phosphate cytidylyltransferase [Planctomycetota bacterium]
MGADTAAVLVAAGLGRRMGERNKTLMRLAGKPVLEHSLATFRACPSIGQIIVVMKEVDLERLAAEWHTTPQELGADVVVVGGAERWLSSRNGCEAANPEMDYLLVHDAARPLVTASDVEAVIAGARRSGAAIAAQPVTDTLKMSCAEDRVQSTMSRDSMWRALTPQVARFDWMLDAFAQWNVDANGLPTDESMMLEHCGHAPELIAGHSPNFKITAPRDLLLAEALFRDHGPGSSVSSPSSGSESSS